MIKAYLILFLAYVLPLFGIEVIDTYVFSNCDIKFGCNGGVTFSLFLYGAEGVVAGLGGFVSLLTYRKLIKNLISQNVQVIIAAAGIIFCAIFEIKLQGIYIPVLGEFFSIIMAFFGAGLLSVIGLLLLMTAIRNLTIKSSATGVNAGR